MPHFHAKYGGQTAVFTIADLQILEGELPGRVRGPVLEWAFEHRAALLENWNLTQSKKPMKGEIFEPLRDIDYFKTVQVNTDIDTIVWANGADISLDFLYAIGERTTEDYLAVAI
jgi:hypothetical protein